MLRLDHKVKLATLFLPLAVVVVMTACTSPPAVVDEGSAGQNDDRPDDRLVLQSHYAGPDGWPAVWTIRADGSGLVKLTDGTFLAKSDG
jgi:hypothetical protein